MWCRFVVVYLDFGKWPARVLYLAGCALLAFNVAALAANPFCHCFFHFDEQGVYQIDYLRNLNSLYEDFIYNKYRGRVMTIEVDALDFQHRTADFAGIIDRIDTQLFGLF